jgi:hypothetical protein
MTNIAAQLHLGSTLQEIDVAMTDDDAGDEHRRMLAAASVELVISFTG